MMPLAAFVPFSGSNSNHSSSRSADDCVDELGDALDFLLAQARAVLAELQQAAQVAPAQRGRIRWHKREHRLDRLGRACHLPRIFVRRFGVARRVTIDFAARQVVIVPAREVIAVVERRDRARQRQYLEAVPRQFEVADDLGPQQADDVRKLREPVAGEYLFGNGRAADDVAPLEHDDLLACPRQIRRSNQAVVAAADDDRIVMYCWPRLFLLPLGLVERQLRPPWPARTGGDAPR